MSHQDNDMSHKKSIKDEETCIISIFLPQRTKRIVSSITHSFHEA